MGGTPHGPAPGAEGEAATRETVERAIDALVEERRVTCLWSYPEGYFPRTDRERIQVLEAIQERSGGAVFQRAGLLKAWLSRHSSDASASS